ncbi:IclR family transcriptional regulator [Herbiconiux sp. VKM Ac-1786]|uniref:IclR family transcriptional regulator n=1 Tax=Herbiconiux sp. VKM Ac-1786 TaxID=2783824 RepID=UPI00188B8CEC|nr:IclR family transcriptional regulator [Herbiconiux sp. VKM Ac-1786]MBF4571853.1 IclR family transcriptional regulator [Herbiconiux sp. VKM Ac-1786]
MSSTPSELPPYAIESVDNALRLLLLFQNRQKLRVSDVSEELGIARSTAHRLLATMAHRGFVFQERGSKGYYLGRALLEIGLSASGHQGIRRAARPHLEQLAEVTHETASLMVLEGGGSRFIDSIESDQLVRVASRTGTLLPAQASSGGKVLLAELDETELRTLFASGFNALTTQTITNWSDLLSELKVVRDRGYATNRGETLTGLRAIAVPVRDHEGRTIASLALSVPDQRVALSALESFLPDLRATAEAISLDL